MARSPKKPSPATSTATPSEKTTRPADPRRAVVEALMHLASEQPYGSISLSEIAAQAGISLADLRDLFPSKGAILGGLLRIIDRQVLEDIGTGNELEGESAHDRLLDVMMRRFDALAPYKEGIRAVHHAIHTDPVFALAINQAALNSWRYMLEAVHIDTQGPMGALRVQGAALVFAKAVPAWLNDEPDMARTMAKLDRELKRGGQVLGAADAFNRLTAPFIGLVRAVCERRSDRRHPERSGAEYV